MRIVKAAAVLLAAGLLFLQTACANTQKPQWLTCDIPAAPQTLDPQFAPDQDSEATVLANVFEGLTRVSPDGAVTMACAKDCKVSADGLRYTFTLRDGLQWADASPLVAGDFAFAFRRLFAPNAPSAWAGRFLCIENAPEALSGQMGASSLRRAFLSFWRKTAPCPARNAFSPSRRGATA
jgi:ABC-type oligopeptide transport system substrate-binding subunit